MALFSLNREEKAYREFYKKTGIEITNEPISDKNAELDEELEELYYQCRTHPRKSIPKLEKLKKQYPQVPSIKNYLFVTYTMTGQRSKADKILEETLEKHPKYVFGVANKIRNTNDEKELKKLEYLLGNPKDIRELEGYDQPIHISAFKNYQAAVAHFEAVFGNEEAAIERLETLIELRVEKEFLDEVAMGLAHLRISNMKKNFESLTSTRITSESEPTIFLSATDNPPKLNHPELEVFYQKSISNFPEEDIKRIEALPKETLIVDLENILEDSIRRWEILSEEDFDDSTREFMIHALFWLGDLKSEESLEKVLNLLRMGEEFTEYWMADMYEEFFYPTLYYLGESQLEKLKAFILEDKIYPFYRLRASQVASQVAIQQPHRREEVIQWYRDIFDFLLQNSKNQYLIDTNFIGFLITDIVDFRGVELWDSIEAINEKGWVQKNIMGDIEEIKREIHQPFHESELQPLPLNIREFYSEEYEKRKVPRPPLREEDLKILEKVKNPTKGEALVMKKYNELFSSVISKEEFYDDDFPIFEEEKEYDYDLPKPVVRTEKKVGRNDPCPCGSGKKYKKCCLNK